ncbi:MAG: MFS transporter [Hyphomonadaceae bacterium]|nr:MAG: transport protein [Caulobacteraceae bacterium]MBT9446772.1 MFS transporter [Hyphomonadaceae bacterium]TPW03551.1 MAG: transport protein [Alphaproteobacteria bacterium]
MADQTATPPVWRLWLAILGLAIPVYATITLSPLMNGAAMDTLHINEFQIGLVRTCEVAINATLTIWLALRLGRLKPQYLGVAGGLLMLAGNLTVGFGDSVATLVAGRLAAGAGAALSATAGSAIIARMASPHRISASLAIPITTCSVLAAVVGGRASQAMGLTGVGLTLSVLCVVGLALALLAPRTPFAKETPTPRMTQMAALLRNPYVLASAITFVGSTAVWSFFERKGLSLGLTQTNVGDLIASSSIAGGLLGTLAIFARDAHVRVAAVIAVVIFGIGHAMQAIAPNVTAFAAGAFVTATTFSYIATFTTAIGVRLDRTGGLNAAGNGWASFFNAFAPAIGGALIMTGSFLAIAVLCIACMIATAILLWISARNLPSAKLTEEEASVAIHSTTEPPEPIHAP